MSDTEMASIYFAIVMLGLTQIFTLYLSYRRGLLLQQAYFRIFQLWERMDALEGRQTNKLSDLMDDADNANNDNVSRDDVWH